MFCPHCRVEYRRGFLRCNDCGVDLVEQLPRGTEPEKLDDEVQDDCVMLLWRGSEGSTFASIVEALEEAVIHYRPKILEPKITLSATYAPLEIWVSMGQTEEARQVLTQVARRIAKRLPADDSENSRIDDAEPT